MTDEVAETGAAPASADPDQKPGTEPAAAPYRVLARKYRPQSFADLIGQEALVRTLKNAIENRRLPHAIVLTGVRGVGKTTTARIIAKAINYAGPDGTAAATVGDTSDCPICRAIAEDRHPDVIEMDAASRTGVDDIRDLIEGVRYRPTSARYKVYIVDEVHMLSRNAFNALLKTLEEPPEHVVFIFATTEIRKVPVTVLSRCMRFDLRRVEQPVLAQHFARICGKEGVSAEEEALAMIARAADGSVRDGLSLLDQAIALSEGRIAAATVKEMLGLADRTRIYDLFEEVMRGRTPEALEILADLYNGGADPLVVLQDLLELTHGLGRAKLLPERADEGLPEAERRRGRALAEGLSMPVLTRTWQLLLKGLEEVQRAPAPLAAAEMVLIRLAFASELPDPGELVRRLREGGAPAGATAAPAGPGGGAGGGPRLQASGVQAPEPAPRPRGEAGAGGGPRAMPAPSAEARTEAVAAVTGPKDYRAVVELVAERRELALAEHLRRDVHLVSFQPGRIELNPREEAPRDLAGRLGRLLGDATGQRWVVSVSDQAGQPTLADQDADSRARKLEEVRCHPLVKAALETFPGAEIKAIRETDEPLPAGGGPVDPDEAREAPDGDPDREA
ncbi:DNA polymerase-3 subunit gamma/tau [Tistlia consotensis]|uniref:DNA polymerase III subunit gamma/tau n=1 Tax=Tistlia consotensis USBA 355 TaxID=560819 RepID=A0A1Y6BFQ2_9PROT|nr:DNA polymerase III subunit gamma/tau [Tistlia consotensis]SMF07596.1 DNA polymerase-3 subunit gamma/tau [Tistlia consotensis USBA 355]SNR35796.1 DNA polymerase-3 subunit gamma/tau [Tistlia consotensis]